MDFVIKAGQLLLSLSILVILHEFGHFFFAKLFKTRVEKFYLFFDPWFSLFKFKKGDTEYGIGWLPLGGYVKISGMIDESMDKEALKEEPKPYEFRSKPTYQRLLIMIGGVLVNFLLAFFIFWMVLYSYGESYVNVEDAKYGLAYHPLAHEIGLNDGDVITHVDTFKVKSVRDIPSHILLEEANHLTVKRADSTFVLPIPEDFGKKLLDQEVKTLAQIRMPFVITNVLKGDNADLAGIKTGDRIVSINGQETPYFTEATKLFAQNKDKRVDIGLIRNNTDTTVRCEISDKGLIGVHAKVDFFEETVTTYGFWEALPAGVSKGINTLVSYVKQLKLVFSKEGVKQIGGFGAIGGLFPPTWNWGAFWELTGFLSIILAFMNILPIPALDGGHVLFLMYEMVSGRKPSDKFLEYATIAGMVLLFSLLIFANGNDIFRAFFK
ncbi:site-2 protease. Metallo peptidase. MEROPS family M50B [Saccharicrinis carchari]|uniref:Zinc metalloprotease n=1 Tax=Saccharicrinis carchari TaxID=1168039 RepID=A0A521F1Z0_SACCC|nr:RIP metalloprotease RseP [Saccharicrinis carchari]SMO90127.1 site-2 protease. Metallo peptidase. MEROPS family M50B [Saccharicrinis carchari]